MRRIVFLVLFLPGPILAQNRAVTGEAGMAVSAYPEASRIGVSVLRRGGNVMDAAVAVGFALSVVHPSAGNIGGGGFAVAYLKGTGPLTIDFREVAPMRATENMYLDSLGNFDPSKSTTGALAVGVPGTVAGLFEIHAKYGRLPWKDLLEPSIRLAREGLILTRGEAESLNGVLPELFRYGSSRKYFTKGDSTSRFQGGDIFFQKDLAWTLRQIQRQGRDGFYRGTVAERIASEIKKNGGILSEEDLASYEPVWRPPLKCRYRGHEIITMPPPSSGGWALISLLKMCEPYRLDSLGFHSSSAIHLMAEAMKRVFADRSEYLADPDFVDVPVSALLDSSFLAARMSTFDSEKATNPGDIKPGSLNRQEPRHTTHYCIADSAGNMVAVTTTLNLGFGSKLAVGGCGFLLNNEMDDFSAKPNMPNAFGLLGGSANRIQPGKRMLSSMTPTLVLWNGRPHFTVGAPGGPTIITKVFQVITNVIEYGMNIQDAVTALRFHHQWPSDEIEYEPNAISKDAMIELETKGWKLRGYGRWDGGGMDGILIDRAGLLEGAADPRYGDSAVGY